LRPLPTHAHGSSRLPEQCVHFSPPARKRQYSFLSAFPMFVPSLSWQNDHFQVKLSVKSGVFLPVASKTPIHASQSLADRLPLAPGEPAQCEPAGPGVGGGAGGTGGAGGPGGGAGAGQNPLSGHLLPHQSATQDRQESSQQARARDSSCAISSTARYSTRPSTTGTW
jgi:hypothetical protein